MRKPVAKFTAVLLLFLFLEKAGMRLWIHEYFHQGITVQAADSNEKDPVHPDQHLLKAGCDCIDDFFLPVTFAEGFSVVIPDMPASDLREVRYKSFIFSSSYLSDRHRGPPSAS